MTASLVAADCVGFSDGNAGHVYTYPSGAPSVGQLDCFVVSSDTVVSTPSGYSVATSFVSSAGSYFFYRFAVGGEGTTTTITTTGDFNTSVTWSRWDGCTALDVAVNAHVETNGTTTPAVSTGTLAGTNELVIAGGCLHSGAQPTTFVYSSGYAQLGTPVTQIGSGGFATSVCEYRTDAGTAAETPSISWTNNVTDRYILVAAFTTAATPTDIDPDSAGDLAISLGAPTLADGSMAVVPDGIDAPTALGGVDLTDGAMTVVPDGIDAPMALGDPDLNLSAATITPDGIDIPVDLGDPSLAQAGADTLLFPYAQQLLDCLCSVLATTSNPPGICALRAGNQAIQDMGPTFDECCEGQAYVRITGFTPTGLQQDPFPAGMEDQIVPACGIPAWSLHFEVGIFRCMDAEGGLSSSQWANIAAQQMLDAKSIRLAICCFIAERELKTTAVGSWVPQGPEGGCIGGTMPLSIEVLNCGEC